MGWSPDCNMIQDGVLGVSGLLTLAEIKLSLFSRVALVKVSATSVLYVARKWLQ